MLSSTPWKKHLFMLYFFWSHKEKYSLNLPRFKIFLLAKMSFISVYTYTGSLLLHSTTLRPLNLNYFFFFFFFFNLFKYFFSILLFFVFTERLVGLQWGIFGQFWPPLLDPYDPMTNDGELWSVGGGRRMWMGVGWVNNQKTRQTQALRFNWYGLHIYLLSLLKKVL